MNGIGRRSQSSSPWPWQDSVYSDSKRIQAISHCYDGALYVPDLWTNLLSIAAVTEIGMTVHFIQSSVSFNKSNEAFIVGERIRRTLDHLAIVANLPDESPFFITPPSSSIAVRHQRLARVSCKNI